MEGEPIARGQCGCLSLQDRSAWTENPQRIPVPGLLLAALGRLWILMWTSRQELDSGAHLRSDWVVAGYLEEQIWCLRLIREETL